MSGFFWGVTAAAVIFVILVVRSRAKAYKAFSVIDLAEPWFIEQNIEPPSVRFSVYEHAKASRMPGAIVVVGVGKTSTGESVGFAVEIMRGHGAVSGEIIIPDGIALNGAAAFLHAKLSGKPIIDILLKMAEQHRARSQK